MLTKEFLKLQKDKLIAEKKQLERELKLVSEKTGEDGEQNRAHFINVGDDVDSNAFEVTNFEQEITIEKDLENILTKVNNALKRIDENTYDKCKEGDTIHQDRLTVIPWADSCIDHSK